MAAKTVNQTPETNKKKTSAKTSQKTSNASAGTTAKRTTTKKNSSKTGSSTSSGNAAVVPSRNTKAHQISPFAKEAILLVIWALCLFLFFSYFGIGGYIGNFLSNLSFGIFGRLAYLLPILIAVAAAFLTVNHGSSPAVMKTLAAFLFYLTLCSFLGLGDPLYYSEASILDIYEYCVSTKSGGGAIGGEICHLFCPAFGTIGTGIFLTIVLLLCLLLITQRSLLKYLRKHMKQAYEAAKDSSKTYQEERRIRREERQEMTSFTDFPESAFDPEHLSIERKPVARRQTRGGRKNTGLKHTEAKNTECPNSVFQKAERRELSGADASYSSAADQTRILERDVTPSLIVESADRAEPVANTARSARTDIEIPVPFPAAPRQRRQDHRVSGVTTDTKIYGDPSQVGDEVREILSPRSGLFQEEHTDLFADSVGSLDENDDPEGILEEEFLAKLSSFPMRGAGKNTGSQPLEMQNSSAEDVMPEHDPGEQEDFTPGFTLYDEEHERAAQIRKTEITETEEIQLETEEMQPETEMTLPEQEGIPSGITGIDEYSDDLPEESFEEFPEEVKQTSRRSDSFDDFFMSDEEAKLRNETSSGHVFTQPSKRASDGGVGAAKRTVRTEADEPNRGETAAEAAPEHGSRRNPRSSEQEIQAGIADVQQEAEKAALAAPPEYIAPPIELLKQGPAKDNSKQQQEIRKTAVKLQQTLNSFGVRATVADYSCGANVTRYELLPEQGVKVSKIVSLSDDIRLNLAAADIRIEAPIPGKAAVGIEVPNKEGSIVQLRDLLESDEFLNHKSKLAFAVGEDIGGKAVVADIAKMPHLLIAGATGSGKSVCINTLIMSILYKARPDEVKLIMIDPKVVELSVYNGIPHLFIPVVTDPKKAAGALNWGVAEMTDRYNKFAEYGVRDLKGYNQKIESLADVDDPNKPKKLPQIVIIVDELADLMMVAPGEVEDSICRLAQLARAAGIHLIIATQRPSVNVITGLIKANMPSRIAFSVSSGVDSRTILDINGAEKLLGKGDMLFYPQGYQKPARVQGAFVSDEEVSDVVDFLKNQNSHAAYSADMQAQLEKVQQASASSRQAEDVDELFADAGKFIIEKDKASIGMLQRVFKIGFNRAARIMDQLSDAGVVGPEEGTKPRKILMSAADFENYLEQN